MKPAGGNLSLVVNKLAADMRLAEGRIAVHQTLDLGALGGRVQALCESLQSLPAEAASPFLADLERLYDALDRLVQALDDAEGARDCAVSAG